MPIDRAVRSFTAQHMPERTVNPSAYACGFEFCPRHADFGASTELAEQRRCGRLRRAYRIVNGIPVLLIDEARDVDDDEHARLMAQARPADPR